MLMNKPQPHLSNGKRRRISPAILAAVLVLVGVAVVATIHFAGQESPRAGLVLGSGSSEARYTMETVVDAADQVKGLSGRTKLPPGDGMLFKYPNLQQRCMWMKDMNFNLDIVWLDASKRVTSITPNLSPASYPQSYCADAQYVIELNAGETAKHNLRLGQVVMLDL